MPSPVTLVVSDRGKPLPNLTNIVRVLQHDPLWGPDRLWHDEFLNRVQFANSPTRDWRDDDNYRLTVYLQETTGMVSVPDYLVAKAVQLVTRQRLHHIVRDWLRTLVWDGTCRLRHAFEDYWGADRQSSEYVRAASQNFFVGLVARATQPGCKLDTMPVFEGKQGIKKSSALEVIGGAWYAVINEAVSTKDFLQCLPGKWLLEISELQAFTRADVAHVKSMMSTRSDNYRPSYGRNNVEFPRQCAFAGTTNPTDWGTDETGLRRFWPIACGDINLPALTLARDQLFAEAVALFHAGSSWWEMPSQAEGEQAERQAHHPWTEPILVWASLRSEVTTADVLQFALKKDLGSYTMGDAHAVGRVLTLAGWTKKVARRNGRLMKIWEPSVTPSDEVTL